MASLRSLRAGCVPVRIRCAGTLPKNFGKSKLKYFGIQSELTLTNRRKYGPKLTVLI